MARISATSSRGEAGDQFASITRRVPSTSRIQNSLFGQARRCSHRTRPLPGCVDWRDPALQDPVDASGEAALVSFVFDRQVGHGQFHYTDTCLMRPDGRV
jgi:hypothetical protein